LLAILEAFLGILLLVGVFAIVAGFGLPELFPRFRFFPIRLFAIAIVLFVVAAIDFLLAFGLWNGFSWAWGATLVFAILGIAFAVFSLFLRPGIGEILSLIINLLVVYYLMQPRVHTYFTRNSPVTT
jgi:uncharacterized membrane protein (DUF2068 family)